MQERDLVEAVAERWAPESFNRPELRLVFERLLEDPEQGLDVLAQALPAEVVTVLDKLLELPDPNPHGTVESWVTKLQAMALDEERDRLHQELQRVDDPEAKDMLIRRIRVLRDERALLSTHFSRVGPRLNP